jgi:hypothetical protein
MKIREFIERGLPRRVTDHRKDILSALSISREIVRSGHDVTPRLELFTPTGNHLLMMPLPDDEDDRAACFHLARLIMIWQAVHGFILSSELKKPDALSVLLVTRDQVVGTIQRIERIPLSFGEVQWLDRGGAAGELSALLPPKTLQLSQADADVIESFDDQLPEGFVFVKDGELPCL